MLKKSLSFALLVVVASAHSAVLYNSTDPLGPVDGTGLFSTATNRIADDFQFGPLGSTYNPAVTVTGLEMGYSVTGPTAGFIMKVNLYSDMDITSTGSSNPNVLSGLAKSYSFTFSNNLASGRYTTGMIDLTDPLRGGAANLGAISNFARNGHGIEVAFYNLDGVTLSSTVRALFKGDVNPSTGYSYDVYGRDFTGGTPSGPDGIIGSNELARFNNGNGAPFLANYYMKIEGQPVPEPASMTALALGAVAMLRRRKRA